jgi:DNA-binding transcriptional regulator YdaS (Cro superfamily)
MKTQHAIEFFGTAAELAKALGITPGAISQWGEDVPALRAYQITELMQARKPAEPKTTKGRSKKAA